MNNFKYGTYGYVAERDLDTAKANAGIGQYCAAGFYSQQCVEKILKHLIQKVYVGRSIDDLLKTHKLKKLYDTVKDVVDLSEEMIAIYSLTDCYYDSRYPGEDYFELRQEDAEEYLNLTERIFNKVKLAIKTKTLKESSEF